MSTRNYPTGYKVHLHNVLLINCMDLRLLNNIVHFMEHENLTNRYDQYIMAGASFGALVGSADEEEELKNINGYKGWETGLLRLISGKGRARHGKILQKATALIEAGKLRPLVDTRRFTLDTIADAYTVMEQRTAQGKLIIDVDEN